MKLKLQRYDREHEDVPLEECESKRGQMVLFSDVAEVLGPYLYHERACRFGQEGLCTCGFEHLRKELAR